MPAPLLLAALFSLTPAEADFQPVLSPAVVIEESTAPSSEGAGEFSSLSEAAAPVASGAVGDRLDPVLEPALVTEAAQ
jgi:hypothetical protein